MWETLEMLETPWAIQDLNIFRNRLKNKRTDLKVVQNPVQFCHRVEHHCRRRCRKLLLSGHNFRP